MHITHFWQSIILYIHLLYVRCLRRIKRKTNFMILKKKDGHFIWNGFCCYYEMASATNVLPDCCCCFLFFFSRAWKKFSRRHVRLQLRVTRNNTRHSLFFPSRVSMEIGTCFFFPYSTLIYLSFHLLWLRWREKTWIPRDTFAKQKPQWEKVSRTVKFRSTKLNKIILGWIFLEKKSFRFG